MGQMKYYLTYPDRKSLEFARNDLGNHSGNVIAVYAGPIAGQQGLSMFAWIPTGGKANAEVVRGRISLLYLIEYCRAINEAEARAIHPNLFRAIVEDARNN